METLTAQTITNEQIRELREEAVAAGDYKQADLCNRALVGDRDTLDQDGNPIAYADWSQEQARDACSEAINSALAQE